MTEQDFIHPQTYHHGQGHSICETIESKFTNLFRPIEIEFENNCCCMEIHNTSDSTVEFLHGQEYSIF